MCKWKLLAAILMGITLAGCKNSSRPSQSTPPVSEPPPTSTAEFIETGMLDPLQSALSDNLFMTLGDNLPAETQEINECLDVVVSQNTVDLVDVLVNGVASTQTDPSVAYQTTIEKTNLGLQALISNLIALLNVATGENSGCIAGGFEPSENVLASIVLLNDLNELLVAEQEDPNLSTLNFVANQISSVLLSTLGQTPEEARSVPVLGGLISVLEAFSFNLESILLSILNYNGAGANTGLEVLVSELLLGISTQVIPLSMVSPELASELGSFSVQVALLLGSITGPLLQTITLLADSGLQSILNPVELILMSLLVPVPG